MKTPMKLLQQHDQLDDHDNGDWLVVMHDSDDNGDDDDEVMVMINHDGGDDHTSVSHGVHPLI